MFYQDKISDLIDMCKFTTNYSIFHYKKTDFLNKIYKKDIQNEKIQINHLIKDIKKEDINILIGNF